MYLEMVVRENLVPIASGGKILARICFVSKSKLHSQALRLWVMRVKSETGIAILHRYGSNIMVASNPAVPAFFRKKKAGTAGFEANIMVYTYILGHP